MVNTRNGAVGKTLGAIAAGVALAPGVPVTLGLVWASWMTLGVDVAGPGTTRRDAVDDPAAAESWVEIGKL